MRKGRFKTIEDVLSSALFSRAPAVETTDRVFKSTRLEDKIYGEMREGDTLMDGIAAQCEPKLSTFGALSRDVFQSVYSLNVRRNDEATLSSTAKEFNAHILDTVVNGDDYGAMKAVCEGRQLPAYEAASEFVENISANLDGLLKSAGGDKNMLGTLEKLKQQESELQDKLEELLNNRAENDTSNDSEILQAAEKAASKSEQVAAVSTLIQNSLTQDRKAVAEVIQNAATAAKDKAEDVTLALKAWGQESGDDSTKLELDRAVISRVHQSDTLKEITKYLGRFKEIAANARKNGYAYGRGEKYTIEYGNNLSRVLTSGFATLATPATIPLFLRKYQTSRLPQYKRREAITKGSGDIIMCLDESGSTKDDAAWGKAVALTLLDAAMRGGRKFALIHFSGANSCKVDVFKPGEYSAEDVYAAAETFLGGGTDFETPLKEALLLMDYEGFENADIVFTTDGECSLPEDFTNALAVQKAAQKFTITGVLLDMESPGMEFSLASFCDDIFRTSELAMDSVASAIITARA